MLVGKGPLDFRHDNCDMKGITDVITTTEISLNSVILLSNGLTPLFCIEFKLWDFRNIPQSFFMVTCFNSTREVLRIR